MGSAASGFTLLQVDVDERAYRVHRRLSSAALRALLAATPHAPPLLLQQSVPTQRLPFLPRERAMLPLRTAPAEAFVKTALLEIGARSQLPSAAFRPLSGSGRGGVGPSPNPKP